MQTPCNLWRAAALTHLCDLFLECERESGSSVGERTIPVGHVLQPLDDEGGRDVEREVPYDVEVWWICGDTHTCKTPRHVTSERSWRFNSPTFLPRLGDARWESSVHSVGEYVAVDDPQLPWRRLGQQLWR